MSDGSRDAATVRDRHGDTGRHGDTARRAAGNSFLGDTVISLRRWLVKTSRNPFVTFTSLVQPILFFVLIAEVFGSIAGGALSQSLGQELHYVIYLTPAIVIQSALAASAVSGIGLVVDMEMGMFEKTLVSPMHRGAMLLGKVAAELVRIVIQTGIILVLGGVMLALKSGGSIENYLQTGVPGLLGIGLVVLLFSGLFMSYSNVVALVTRDREATIMLANLLTFPLLFVSSAFLPLKVLPEWIEILAIVNPITYGVDGIRALMLGEDVMTVVEVTAFSGVWNTLVPAIAALVAFNVVLGAVALAMLDRASKAEVQ